MSNETRQAWEGVVALLSGQTLPLGPVTTDRYLGDPKRLCFFLSRYKFAGKMMKRCKRVVDIGCGDGMGTVSLITDTKAEVLGIDFDAQQIAYANSTLVPALEAINPAAKGRLKFECLDIVANGASFKGKFDGLVSMDVIEHIAPKEEKAFLEVCRDNLSDRGVALIGTPNDFASPYASQHSQVGHINMFTPDRLQETLERYFSRVFLFSMNDEMVHTGFDKMAHYLMALAVK
jgi:cyclopropane fatty-acyl-phospholipid synthase-like methyltransferase